MVALTCLLLSSVFIVRVTKLGQFLLPLDFGTIGLPPTPVCFILAFLWFLHLFAYKHTIPRITRSTYTFSIERPVS